MQPTREKEERKRPLFERGLLRVGVFLQSWRCSSEQGLPLRETDVTGVQYLVPVSSVATVLMA